MKLSSQLSKCFVALALVSSSWGSVQAGGTLYNEFDYKAHPWALDFIDKDSDSEWKFIARFQYTDPLSKKSAHFVFYGNPTDARGYRTMVRLSPTQPSGMLSTYNRPYEHFETLGLYNVLPLLTQAYQRLGLYAQVADAGNNSHLFVTAENQHEFYRIKNTRSYLLHVKINDPEKKDPFENLDTPHPTYKGMQIERVTLDIGTMIIGTINEPGMLHAHIMGRGDPAHAYIGNLILGGPNPGEMFNLRGDGKEPGNDNKLGWWISVPSKKGPADTYEQKREKQKKYEPMLQAFSRSVFDVFHSNPVEGLVLESTR